VDELAVGVSEWATFRARRTEMPTIARPVSRIAAGNDIARAAESGRGLA
jgi:hypothetical protein